MIKLTDSGRKVIKGIRCETQQERAFPNTRISDQQNFEQVIKFWLPRRRTHRKTIKHTNFESMRKLSSRSEIRLTQRQTKKPKKISETGKEMPFFYFTDSLLYYTRGHQNNLLRLVLRKNLCMSFIISS